MLNKNVMNEKVILLIKINLTRTEKKYMTQITWLIKKKI